ncbi:hypothetical protein [Bdellovibrio bacteriovorus]|uniref:hypothetical protein n=1 Tax=Bdellovibrio bacteriovorus TaxID=959 RepID=UPI0035A6AB0A
MRIRTLVMLSGAITVLGVGLIVMSEKSKPETESQAAPTQEAPAANPVESEKETAIAAGTKPAAMDVIKSSQTMPVVFKEFKQARDLKKYADLSHKALLLEPDKIVKRRLLKDEDFLKSLEALLKTAPNDEESQQMQNSALDFVFEALNTDMKSAAIEVLKGVVADATVENSAVNEMDRKVLAGVKAEALHNWAAADPSAESSINSLLPGPVSQKIWANVKHQQESNMGESAMLQAGQ